MRPHLEEGRSHRKINIVRRQVSWRNSRTHWVRLTDTASATMSTTPPYAGPNMIWPTIWSPGMAIGWLYTYGSLESALSGHPSRQKSLLRRPRQGSRTCGALMLGDTKTRRCSASHRIDFCRAGCLRQSTSPGEYDNRHRFRRCRPRQSGARQEQTRLDCGSRDLCVCSVFPGGGSGVAMGRSAVHATVTWLGRLRPAIM